MKSKDIEMPLFKMALSSMMVLPLFLPTIALATEADLAVTEKIADRIVIDFEADARYYQDFLVDGLPKISYFSGYDTADLSEKVLTQIIGLEGEVRARSNIMSNATFDARHLVFPSSSVGSVWGINHWEKLHAEHGWVTAFSLQPEIQSMSPGHEESGWYDSADAWSDLTPIQRDTIALILQFGYGNFYGVSGLANSDDSIIVTQIAIWEVVLGLWDLNTPWSGWSTRNDQESTMWYFNERLIRTSGIASGLGGIYYNGFDQQYHNHTTPIGNQNRVNRYNRLRLDINDFGRLATRPQFTHATATIAGQEEHVHRLTWNTIRNRYEVTLSDSAQMGGNQVLNRFLTLQTGAASSWFAPGLRVERTGANAIRVYAVDSISPPIGRHTSSSNLLRLNNPSSVIPIAWYYHPEWQNKIIGNFTNPATVYFVVEVQRRPAYAEATMISAFTGNPLPGTVFELQRRNPADTDWNPVAGVQIGTTDENGVVRFAGLTPNRRYRIREVSVPAPYIINTTWRELTALPNQTMRRQFYVEPAQGYIQIIKQNPLTDEITFYIYAAKDIVHTDGTIIYPAGTRVDTVIMNDNHQALTRNLPLGIYYIRDSNNERTYRVEIEFVDQITAIVQITVTIRNSVDDSTNNPESDYDDSSDENYAGNPDGNSNDDPEEDYNDGSDADDKVDESNSEPESDYENESDDNYDENVEDDSNDNSDTSNDDSENDSNNDLDNDSEVEYEDESDENTEDSTDENSNDDSEVDYDYESDENTEDSTDENSDDDSDNTANTPDADEIEEDYEDGSTDESTNDSEDDLTDESGKNSEENTDDDSFDNVDTPNEDSEEDLDTESEVDYDEESDEYYEYEIDDDSFGSVKTPDDGSESDDDDEKEAKTEEALNTLQTRTLPRTSVQMNNNARFSSILALLTASSGLIGIKTLWKDRKIND